MRSAKSSKNDGVEILIAEDSPTQAEQLKYLLEEHGYTVTVAANGKQALAAARERKPALILSDIVMPEMDGYAFCKQIKSNQELEDTPFVLLTALTGPQDILKGLECGADNFITKPYEAKSLLSRIQHILLDRQLPKRERVQFGAEIYFDGKKQFITAEQQQILGLLLSTYEEAVRINQKLEAGKKELERSYQSLHALYRLAEELNDATSEKEVLEKALERAMELPSVQAGWISLREAETGFRLDAARSLPPALEPPGVWVGDCLCRKKLLAGELERVSTILDCERLQSASGDTRGLSCHASIPLRRGDQVVGVMNLAGPDHGLFCDEDLKTLHGVGNQIAVAIQRAYLLEQLARKVEERTAALTAEVAQRKRSEEAMVASLARGQALVSAMGEIVYEWWPKRDEVRWEGEYTRVLGYTPEEIGRDTASWNSRVHPEDQPATSHEVEAAKNDRRLYDLEYRFRRRDGTYVWMHDRGVLMLDEAGNLERIVGVFRDITTRRTLEQQFHQAQKMEAVGRLAGGVAHDFNNLLGIVLGYSELLLESLPASDPARHKVEQIKDAAQRATGVTRQLLAFSRKQVLEPQILNVNDVASGMKNILQRLLGEDIELVLTLAPDVKAVKADQGQLEQVIMNLAVNARDAMPRGGKLVIETQNVFLDEEYSRQHVSSQHGPFVMLAVSDTGMGMDEETRLHMFEPFFTTKPKDKGTGLGLATVYGIVKQSDGFIWVYSELGRGTTFKVYLPQVQEKAVSARAAEAAENLPRGTETVLVVEDEKVLCEVTCEFLRGSGYRILTATSSAEALHLVQTHPDPIELLVTDVVMPGMGGRELAECILRSRPGMKVLYVSGYTDDAILQHGILETNAAFLQKPFSKSLLTRKVREVLGERVAGGG